MPNQAESKPEQGVQRQADFPVPEPDEQVRSEIDCLLRNYEALLDVLDA